MQASQVLCEQQSPASPLARRAAQFLGRARLRRSVLCQQTPLYSKMCRLPPLGKCAPVPAALRAGDLHRPGPARLRTPAVHMRMHSSTRRGEAGAHTAARLRCRLCSARSPGCRAPRTPGGRRAWRGARHRERAVQWPAHGEDRVCRPAPRVSLRTHGRARAGAAAGVLACPGGP